MNLICDPSARLGEARPKWDPSFYFGSPNAYLAHRVIPAIEERTGTRFKYRPVLLGGLFKLTGNQAPSQAFANIPKKLAYERLELMRFVKKHSLVKAGAILPHRSG